MKSLKEERKFDKEWNNILKSLGVESYSLIAKTE